VSRFNFGGQLCEEGHIAGELCRQTLITALVGPPLPLIIRSNSIGSMPSLAASVKTSVPRVAHKSATFRLWHFGVSMKPRVETIDELLMN
jgi:hypothetical protein